MLESIKTKEAEAPPKDITGSGDGLLTLTPTDVRQVGSRVEVAWEESDLLDSLTYFQYRAVRRSHQSLP